MTQDTIDDGGPAFPTQNGPHTYHYSGITLRDLVSLVIYPTVYSESDTVENAANAAWVAADAWLKARAQ